MVFSTAEMQVWICLCILLIQAFALPQQWGDNMRQRLAGAVPPSRHGAHPDYPPMGEPIYPPAAVPGSLLSMDEQMGVGMAQDQFPSIVPSFDSMVPGYIPTSTPFDNPTTLSDQIKMLPDAPDCSIRPQTVTEIQRMRDSASKIAVMMQSETLIMNKRKTYVEQMTAYLNDRIRELNKVKQELAQETRWLDLSSNRIFSLEEKEKLIKLQDIQSCLNDQTTRSNADISAVGKSLTDIQSQAATVQASINAIQARMNAINAGAGSSGASGVAATAVPPT